MPDFSLYRLLIVFLLGWSLPVAAQTPLIEAESYILLDAQTGTVLAEKNADLPLPPASLTKIMSAYVVFQAIKDGVLSLGQEVTISRNAWGSNVVGSKMFIEVNKQVTVEELLRGVIVQSGNDASIALAEAVAGDEQLFAAEMNRMAEKMGLANSHFRNATGLPADRHYSSARDVAVMSWWTARDFPELYKMYSEREYTYNNIRQENRNRLLAKFPGADGVKTGYTKEAGYCLAAAATRRGRRLVAVVMRADSTLAREQEAAKLLTYGFNNFRTISLFSADDIRALPVWGGVAAQISVQPARAGVYALPRRDNVELQYQPQPNLRAPIAKGDVLGELRVLVNGAPHDSVEVVAAEAVAAGSWWRQLKDTIKVEWLGHGGGGNAVLSQW